MPCTTWLIAFKSSGVQDVIPTKKVTLSGKFYVLVDKKDEPMCAKPCLENSTDGFWMLFRMMRNQKKVNMKAQQKCQLLGQMVIQAERLRGWLPLRKASWSKASRRRQRLPIQTPILPIWIKHGKANHCRQPRLQVQLRVPLKEHIHCTQRQQFQTKKSLAWQTQNLSKTHIMRSWLIKVPPLKQC